VLRRTFKAALLVAGAGTIAVPAIGAGAPAARDAAAPAARDAGASAAHDSGFRLVSARVTPREAFFDTAGGAATARLRFTADGPQNLSLSIAGGGKEVRRIAVKRAEPGKPVSVAWNGLRKGGKLVPQGDYKVVLKAAGSPKRLIGKFSYHHDFFPIRGSHHDRGGIGYFGAPRSGGRVHEGFDIDARCGTPLVAARGGRVAARGYDPDLHGNYILIAARRSPYAYFYAHMRHGTPWRRGDRIHTGDRVGVVGLTGNAHGTPCHLHFEVHRHGRPLNPEPFLHRWDRWS